MQVLKDKIKDKLLNAAISEFREKGFQKSSMRSIAQKAGITVGNLYRYYQNKNDLFYTVVSPAYHKIISLINEQRKHKRGETKEYRALMEHIASSIVEIHKIHRHELFILIEGSAGTIYENAKEDIIFLSEEQIRMFIVEEVNISEHVIKDAFFARVLAVSFVEGLLEILKRDDDQDNMKNNILLFQHFYFRDIANRFR